MKNRVSKPLVLSLFLTSVVLVIGTAPTSFAATTAKATPKATAKATPKATAAARGGAFASITAAQRTCLKKQGVALPTAGGARPTPGASRPAGGFGGGFNSAKNQAAFKKCGVTLPTGGFGGGGAVDTVKLAAFQKCMTKAGFKATGPGGRYDQSDPDTAIALIKCQKSTGFTLPTRGQPGTGK